MTPTEEVPLSLHADGDGVIRSPVWATPDPLLLALYPDGAECVVRATGATGAGTVTATATNSAGEPLTATHAVTVAAPAAKVLTIAAGTPRPIPVDPPPPAGRRLLGAGDIGPPIVYPGWGGDANYGAGLTHWFVGGELRLMTMVYRGNGELPAGEVHRMTLTEFRVPARPGDPIGEPTATWGDLWDKGFAGNDTHQALWYEQAADRLWHAGALDYPQQGFSTDCVNALSVRALNRDGTAAGFRGFFGPPGVGQRAQLGGIKPVPAWFERAHCPGMKYLLGHGGYSSRMSYGLGPSIGPMFVFCADPTADGGQPWDSTTGTLSPGRFQIAADFRGDYRPGQMTPVENYLDGGDVVGGVPRQNPDTRPTLPPDPAGKWIGRRPDGKYHCSWVFTFGNTLNWLDDAAGTRPVHGILALATVAGGKAWYQTGSVRSDRLAVEAHVYDPAVLAAALAAGVPARPEPTHHFALDLPPGGAVLGATVVPETNRLYVLRAWVGPDPVRTALYEFALPGGA